MPTETLTIEIQGDSSSLAASLDEALSRIESLQSSADSAGAAAEGIGGRLGNVSTAVGSLSQVSQALTRVSQQAAAIGQQPVTLNVEPALGSLQMLLSAIQAVAAQLQALSSPVAMLPSPGPGSTGPIPGSTSPRTGGQSMSTTATARATTVTGTGGLSAANFSQTRAAMSSAAGDSFATIPRPPMSSIERILSTRESKSVSAWVPPTSPNASSATTHASTDRSVQHFSQSQTSELSQLMDRSTSSAITNHFGGITIAVRETADVNSLIRDLRLQGLSLRHRQG